MDDGGNIKFRTPNRKVITSPHTMAVKLDVLFNGSRMGTVDKLWFTRNSDTYCRMLASHQEPNIIDIPAEVTPNSVNEFLNICNGGSVDLNPNNISDLYLLFETWEMTGQLELANQYLNEHRELLLQRITMSMRQGRSTAELEVLLRQQIVRLCQDPQAQAPLMALGIDMLMRVFSEIELSSEDIHRVFPFLLSCLTEIGGSASYLFSRIRMNDLTVDELGQLAGNPNLDSSVLPRSDIDLVKENKFLRESLDRCWQEMRSLKAELEELKRRPVVECQCQESEAMITCPQCQKTMHFVSDYTNGPHQWECLFSQARPFDGIFSEMRRKCGKNPHAGGLVKITSSGEARNRPWQVVDPDWDEFFQTGNVPGSFIQFDFGPGKILLAGYTLLLLQYVDSRMPCPPGSWFIEISDDQREWTVVDRREGQGGEDPLCFKLKRPHVNRACQYVRLKQERNASWDPHHHYLTLRRIEFFGKVLS